MAEYQQELVKLHNRIQTAIDRFIAAGGHWEDVYSCIKEQAKNMERKSGKSPFGVLCMEGFVDVFLGDAHLLGLDFEPDNATTDTEYLWGGIREGVKRDILNPHKFDCAGVTIEVHSHKLSVCQPYFSVPCTSDQLRQLAEDLEPDNLRRLDEEYQQELHKAHQEHLRRMATDPVYADEHREQQRKYRPLA